MKPLSLVKYRSTQQLKNDYERGHRPRLLFTDHANHRLLDMKRQGLSTDEAADAICAPVAIWWSDKYQSMLLHGRRVTASVVVGGDGFPVIVTFLWRTREDWVESYRNGPPSGRERRDDLTHLPSRDEIA